MDVAIRLDVEKPLTLEDIMPPEIWWDNIDILVNTKIYAGGERVDGGWKNNRNSIIRKIPTQISRKYHGKIIKSMTVILNMEDRHTIETIFATYTGNVRVEYGIFVKE